MDRRSGTRLLIVADQMPPSYGRYKSDYIKVYDSSRHKKLESLDTSLPVDWSKKAYQSAGEAFQQVLELAVGEALRVAPEDHETLAQLWSLSRDVEQSQLDTYHEQKSAEAEREDKNALRAMHPSKPGTLHSFLDSSRRIGEASTSLRHQMLGRACGRIRNDEETESLLLKLVKATHDRQEAAKAALGTEYRDLVQDEPVTSQQILPEESHTNGQISKIMRNALETNTGGPGLVRAVVENRSAFPIIRQSSYRDDGDYDAYGYPEGRQYNGNDGGDGVHYQMYDDGTSWGGDEPDGPDDTRYITY